MAWRCAGPPGWPVKVFQWGGEWRMLGLLSELTKAVWLLLQHALNGREEREAREIWN